MLRNLDVARERGAAKGAEVDLRHFVACDIRRRGDALGSVEFDAVTLTVAKRQRVNVEALVLGDRQNRGRVQSSTQQHNCVLVSHWFTPPLEAETRKLAPLRGRLPPAACSR